MGSIAGWNDPCILDHQNHGSSRSAGAVDDAFGNDETLPRSQGDSAILKINQQLALDDVKEFVVFVVLVPVIFTFDDGNAHHRFIDFAKGLVEPLEFAGI